MPVTTWQLSLRSLLLLVTVMAGFIGMYLSVWPANPIVPVFFTLLVGTLLGMTWQWKRRRNGVIGGIVGGIVGANLAVALHFICGYTMLEAFEDEGLGLLGGMMIFCPFATVLGAVAGGLLSMIAYPLSSFVNRCLRK